MSIWQLLSECEHDSFSSVSWWVDMQQYDGDDLFGEHLLSCEQLICDIVSDWQLLSSEWHVVCVIMSIWQLLSEREHDCTIVMSWRIDMQCDDCDTLFSRHILPCEQHVGDDMSVWQLLSN